MAQNNQVLPSKEASLFRHLVQNYETKQYKKGIKAAEQILRKQPNHGDTQAMKALIMNSQGKTDEAFELCKLALKNSMKSHVCWHVYGLLYRSVKNYEEAIKAYRFALKLDPDNVQIQRDLALLQVQMRDYAGFVSSRRQMLQQRPNLRQNWTALAVALHLSGALDQAENVLQKYEETLKQAPPKTDVEHAEAVLYKNTIIAEQNELERALEHLNSVSKNALDRTAVLEMKADYLLKLGKKQESEQTYRTLLDRNPENRVYYEGLEKTLGLNRDKPEDVEKLLAMYQEYAQKSSRVDAPRRLPLDFLEGDAFRKHVDQYLRRMFTKGVPSTFANLKQLYTEPQKRKTIQDLVEGYLSEDSQTNGATEVNGSADGSHKTDGVDKANVWQLSVNYFLAQHYSYHLTRDLARAEQHVEKAISLNPSKTDYTYHMTRARILKHQGNTQKASEEMNNAREMDLRDRYINTKCGKYQLRNDENEAALKTMGLFTRKEAVGGPLGDLLDMQCVWYITEDGESYFRQGKLSLALKRFNAVYNIFDTWAEDQFDFHSFSLRKGMIRAYVDMVRWEDQLREHPFYTRAALSAIQIYLILHDKPELAKGGQMNGNANESSADKKKAAKKAKREAEKAEAERKAAAAKKSQPKADDDGATKKEDPDPLGLELIKTDKPLDEALKFLTPILEFSPKNIDGQIAGFEVFIRRSKLITVSRTIERETLMSITEKYLPALKCLLTAYTIDPDHPKCHEQGGRFKYALDHLSEPLPPSVMGVIQSQYLSRLSPKSLEECNEEYLTNHKQSAPHIQSVVRFRNFLKPGAEDTKTKSVKDLRTTLDLPIVSLQDAVQGLRLHDELGASKESKQAYVEAARKRWPGATVFSS